MNITGFQPNLVGSTDKSDNIFKQLASGKRVNSAADDAAGLAIIDRLSAEIDAQQRGAQNGYDGVSLTQTADAAYSEIGEASARIRELSVQAGSGILNDGDRQAIQTEITGLTEHINTVAGQSNFAGIDLLSGNGNIGITLDGKSNIDVATHDAAADLDGLGLNAIDVTTAAGAQRALGVLDSITEYVGTNRGELGATQNRLDSGIRNVQTQADNLA
ncbi:MAG: flagellin, partial [Phenylobacterium sp.]